MRRYPPPATRALAAALPVLPTDDVGWVPPARELVGARTTSWFAASAQSYRRGTPTEQFIVGAVGGFVSVLIAVMILVAQRAG